MKILITGATGFIGVEILRQAIAHNYISHIYTLTRHTLAPELHKHPQVTQLIHADFEHYPQRIVDRLRADGVEACIWALGGNVPDFPSLEEAQRVGIGYTLAGAEVMARELAPTLRTRLAQSNKVGASKVSSLPFRFVYISAWGAEHNQFRTLWVMGDTRRVKGASEKGLFEIADNSLEIDGTRCFEVTALRPGRVLAKGQSVVNLVAEATVPCIAVDRLAKTALDVALEGSKKGRIVENRDCLGEGWAVGNTLAI